MTRANPIPLLILLLIAGPAAADTVRLRSGRTLTGEVVRETDAAIWFRAGPGIEARIPRRDIADLERGPVPETAEAKRPRRGREWEEGHSATCPRGCEECDRLFAASLARISATVDRGHPRMPLRVNLGGWTPLQTVTASVLGLVLLGEGNTLEAGDHSATLSRLAAYVERVGTADDPSCTQFRTWILAFETLFLSELERVESSRRRRVLLGRVVRLLESGQVGTKGWDHGLTRAPGGYGPFTAVSIWCVAALGAASEVGVEVDEAVFRKGRRCLSRALGDARTGARYYADRWTTISPGRTGGVVWALARYGGYSGNAFPRARGFMMKHLWAVPEGHGSGMMNFGWGALGAAMLGEETAARFWRTHRRTVLAHREESGLFAPRPWRDLGFFESDLQKPPFAGQGTTWPDHAYGKAWATPWMLLAWQAGRGKSLLPRSPVRADEDDE